MREPKRPEWRACLSCGLEFFVVFSRTQGRPRLYCETCRPVRAPLALSPRPCAWCKEAFTPRTSRQVCCSRRCNYARRDSRRFTPKGSRLEAVCTDCGKSFQYVSTTKRRTRCDGCRQPAHEPITRDPLSCEECAAAYTPSTRAQRFCSEHCRYAWKNHRRGKEALR